MGRYGHKTVTIDVDIDEFDDEAIFERFLKIAARGNWSKKQLADASKAIKEEIDDLLPPPLIKFNSMYAEDIVTKIKEIIALKGEMFLHDLLEKATK